MFTRIFTYLIRSPWVWICAFSILLGNGVWHWLGTYPQPLLLTWGEEQFETTFQIFVFFLSSVCLLMGGLSYGLFRCLSGVTSWHARKQLDYLLESLSAFYQDNRPLLHKRLEKMRRWRQSPWGEIASLLVARARGQKSCEESLSKLQAFPKTAALVVRCRVEPLLEKKEWSEAAALLRTAFKKDPRNVWVLTQFFQVVSQQRDEETASLLLRHLRKYHPSVNFQKTAYAKLLFLQAEKAAHDPLRREFLLLEAFKQAPDDLDVASALVRLLVHQEQSGEAERLAAVFWPLNPHIPFAKVFLSSFQEDSSSAQFQKIQRLVGDWTQAPQEVACISALLLGYTAIAAHLWGASQEAEEFLEVRRPIWAAFLSVYRRAAQDSHDNNARKTCDLLIAGDMALTHLTQPL